MNAHLEKIKIGLVWRRNIGWKWTFGLLNESISGILTIGFLHREYKVVIIIANNFSCDIVASSQGHFHPEIKHLFSHTLQIQKNLCEKL